MIDRFFWGYVLVCCLMVVGGIGVIAVKSQEKSQAFQPSEVETLRLQVKQKDAQLAQVAYSNAQAAFQKAIADFNAEKEAIKKAHAWPADVDVHPDTLQFFEPPEPPVPAPAEPPKKP